MSLTIFACTLMICGTYIFVQGFKEDAKTDRKKMEIKQQNHEALNDYLKHNNSHVYKHE